jgi:hypothetical protein
MEEEEGTTQLAKINTKKIERGEILTACWLYLLHFLCYHKNSQWAIL